MSIRIPFAQLALFATMLCIGASALAGSRPPVLDASEIRKLKVTIDNSSNCGGSAGNQKRTASATLRGGSPGCKYRLQITVEGVVETQNSGYDYVYLNGEELFGGDNNSGDCTMTTKAATRIIEVESGEAVSLTYDTRDGLYHAGAYAKVTRVIELDSCTDDCTMGGGHVSVGSANVALKMGGASYGASAGAVWMDEKRPSVELASPHVLRYETNLDDVYVVTNSALRQIRTPNGLADIVTLDAFSYEVRFYRDQHVGDYTNGLYQIAGSPFSVWRFENPNASTNNIDDLWISEISGSNTNLHKFAWNDGTQTWGLMRGSGADARTETMRDEAQVVGSYTNVIYTRTVKDATDNIVFAQTDTVILYPWGNETTLTVLDPNGAALTNQWLFYTEADVASTNDSNYGRLKAMITADGYWETYQYDIYGRRTNTIMQHLDSAYASSASENKVVLREFTAGFGNYSQTLTIERVLGMETSRRYTLEWLNGRQDEYIMLAPGAIWWANTNHIHSFTLRDPETGHTTFTKQSDGTITLYTYATNSTTETTTIKTGAPNANDTDVTNGVMTVRTVDPSGNLVSEYRYAIPETNVVLYATEVTETDEAGRPTRIEYLDGTYETKEYACCGLISHRDREGVYTFYSHNEHGEVEYETRAGVILHHTHDAMGRRIRTERKPESGGDWSLVSATEYDRAGRITNTVDAAGIEAVYTDHLDGNGMKVRTTTHADLSTRIETYYSDGHLNEVSGTAAHPKRHLYGVANNQQFTTEIRLDAQDGTNEWTRTWTDMGGRTVLVEYSGGAFELFSYNTQNQLVRRIDRDGLVTLHQYNSLGEREYTALVVDDDGETINFAGADRITRTVRDIVDWNGSPAHRTRRFIWPDIGQDTAVLAQTDITTPDGLTHWSISFGRTNTQHTALDGEGERIVTTIAPDGTYTVSVYEQGRLLSVTHYDANEARIGRTDYGYDVFGRQSTVTDARNGTTTNQHDNADRLFFTTTPAPLPGGTPQTTGYTYNNMGRIYTMTLPDGGVVTNNYHATGELKKTSGTRTYPVEYTYDAQGRMTGMTAWQDHSGDAGQAATTWAYDPQTGFMTAKIYEGGYSNTYTYTSGGRLATRMWARGVITAYQYNEAGELVSVIYSDGTAGVINVYDRLGRLEEVSDSVGTRVMEFDVTGHLVSETYTDGLMSGLSVARDHNAWGGVSNLTWTGASTSSVAYTHNAVARLQTVTHNAYSAEYGYHSDSALISNIAHSAGARVFLESASEYDVLNRLQSIQHTPTSDAPLGYEYIYNQANQRIRSDLADGSNWMYAYDQLGQLTGATRHWSNGVPVAGQSFAYGFDDIGNRTTTTNNGDAAMYTANLLNQYEERDVPGRVRIMGSALPQAIITINNEQTTRQQDGYFYWSQAVANTNSAAYPGVSILAVLQAAATNGADIVSTDTGRMFVAKSPELFTYDLDGNLLTDGRWTNTWDGENRLIRVETRSDLPGDVPRVRMDFTYDVQGRRIQEQRYQHDGTNWMSTASTRFLYDGWLLLAEVDDSDAFTRTYTWGLDLSGSMQGAGGVGGLLAMHQGGSDYAYAYDGNGNVIALTSVDGTTAANYEYGPFGEALRATGPAADANRFRFSTKWMDHDTGWLYYGYRWMDPGTGRFLNRDTIAEDGGLNLFAFVQNHPIDKVDFLGKSSTDGTPPRKPTSGDVRIKYRMVYNDPLAFFYGIKVYELSRLPYQMKTSEGPFNCRKAWYFEVEVEPSGGFYAVLKPPHTSYPPQITHQGRFRYYTFFPIVSFEGIGQGGNYVTMWGSGGQVHKNTVATRFFSLQRGEEPNPGRVSVTISLLDTTTGDEVPVVEQSVLTLVKP